MKFRGTILHDNASDINTLHSQRKRKAKICFKSCFKSNSVSIRHFRLDIDF